jgi:hypothetical protein
MVILLRPTGHDVGMKVWDLREQAHLLGFTPQDQVRWLSPSQLVITAAKVAVSTLFAGYADRREVQAALPSPPVVIDPGPDGLWIDYVADLGDGFDPTYTVAWLLAEPELDVDGLRLPRADVLVFGGDEVYPTSSATGYEDRTTGPYRAALPSAPDAARPPTLLAVPGNHDWYDGLTAFLRVFTQRRSIGGWRTAQTRSYFAARLPHGWWLVGVDTQLGTYIDDPQIRYFREHVSAKLEPGDAVIVCAPTPTWVHTGQGEPDAFNSLHYFEREVVQQRPDPAGGAPQPTGAQVRLWLSGDKHHYNRYAETLPNSAETLPNSADAATLADGASPRQLVTCGLGGAFQLGTADLPATLELPARGSRMSARSQPADFRKVAVWPTVAASRRQRWGIFALTRQGIVARNPGLWRLIGLVHAFVLPVLAFLLGLQIGRGPFQVLTDATVAQVTSFGLQLLGWLAVATAVACLVPLVHRQRPRRPPGWIGAAGLQLLVALAALAGAVAVPWPAAWAGWRSLGAAAFGAFVVAGFVGCYALAVYLMVAPDRSTRDVVFSAQAIEEGKGFLRIHLDDAGRVTVYPVLVERVCHDWELADLDPVVPAGPDRARPVPAPGTAPRPRLVEPPFSVTRPARRDQELRRDQEV